MFFSMIFDVASRALVSLIRLFRRDQLQTMRNHSKQVKTTQKL